MCGTCYLQEENDFKKLVNHLEYISEDEKSFKCKGYVMDDKLEQKGEDENGVL